MNRSNYLNYRFELEACFSFSQCCDVMRRAASDDSLPLEDYCHLLYYHDRRIRSMRRADKCEEVPSHD